MAKEIVRKKKKTEPQLSGIFYDFGSSLILAENDNLLNLAAEAVDALADAAERYQDVMSDETKSDACKKVLSEQYDMFVSRIAAAYGLVNPKLDGIGLTLGECEEYRARLIPGENFQPPAGAGEYYIIPCSVLVETNEE